MTRRYASSRLIKIAGNRLLIRNRLDRSPIELPKHHSGLRSVMAEAYGRDYVALKSFQAARNHRDSIVILEGDDGGTIYLTVPVYKVTCGEIPLHHLLSDIDAICWNDPGMALCFMKSCLSEGLSPVGWAGRVIDGLWLHPKVEQLGVRRDIEQVLNGQRERIEIGQKHWS
jgi:hypothetical protein